MSDDAESKAWSARRLENRESTSQGHTEGERRAGEYGSDNGGFRIRIPGVSGTGRNPDRVSLLTGGIIAQLIAVTEDQLGEVRECVEWYQREQREIEQRLEELRQLRELSQQPEE